MAIPLNILIVEDDPNDAELVIGELRQAGFDPKWKRVQTEPDFLAEIKNSPDVILSDYSMPRFTGLRAAALLRESGLNIPFILVSGTVGEEVAVAAMKEGATDYLLKDRIARLGHSVKHALEEKRLREERKEVQRALDAESYLLHTMIDMLPDYFYVKDTQCRFLVCNEACARLMGAKTSSELIGKTDADFYPSGKVAEFNTDEQAVLKGTPIINKEEPFIHPDGTQEFILTTKLPIKDHDGKITGLVGYGRNITASRKAEMALRESEEKFRQLAEHITIVFWIIDPAKKQVLYVSPAYETIWCQPCESLYQSSQTWFDAIHPDDRQRVLEAWATKQGQGEYDETYRIVRPDKSIRWIRDRGFPLRDATGDIYRVVGTAEDITEKQKLEEQLRQSQKMEAIGQLAGGVAHDFNNILATIQMQADLMKSEGNLSPAQLESAKETSAAAQRGAALTRQLLLFSRKETIQARDLDLNQSTNDLTKMLRRMLGENIQLQFKFAMRPLFVHADAGMLGQVLMNLAVNARDAMPRGGQLIIETSAVEFDAFTAARSPQARPGSFVCLNISDTGCGIPPDTLPRIFEPFFTTKPVGKGTGLGLATVLGIVQQHKGWVDVHSEVGHGTTFNIYLPRLARISNQKFITPMTGSTRGGNETILLVEDELSLRTSVRNALSRLGYSVLEAADGQGALETWKQHGEAVHLLLTDMVMPGEISGKDLADRLLQENPKLKVVYMSGYSTEIAGKGFPLKEGVNFLAKPFEAQTLAQVVRHCLDKK